MLRRAFIALVMSVLATVSAHAADDYPNRPIRLVVGFAPGGSADTNCRLLAAHLSERLGQQVVVDNRPGASGTIAAQAVARSDPDGYTLLYLTSASHAILPFIMPLSYDPMADFSPVILVGKVGMVLIANPASPVSSLDELVAAARAKPGGVAFASPGTASSHHLAMALFNQNTHTEMLHVPYKGSAPALNDVVAGEVPFMVDTISTSLPLIEGGKVRAIAVTSAERSPLLPEVPTFAQAGVQGFDVDVWGGISAPAGTPRAIVERLNRELNAILANPEVRRIFRAKGSEGGGGSPEHFAAFIAAEGDKWREVIQTAGIKAN